MNIKRDVLGLARDQIFSGDVGDVLADVLLDARRTACLRSSSVLASRSAVIASSGNLASMTSGPLIRHEDRAVRPRLVRQRELEFIGAFRQPVGDDRFHAGPWPKAPRDCLLSKHALQRVHLRRQFGDVLLRASRSPPAARAAAADARWCSWSRSSSTRRGSASPRRAACSRSAAIASAILQPVAHGIEPRVEFAQPLLGRRVGRRLARAQQQHDDDERRRRRCTGAATTSGQSDMSGFRTCEQLLA